MLADNYEQLNDRKTANRLRVGFLVGVPAIWFLFYLATIALGGSRGSVSTIVVTTFLSWWIPLFVLDRYYHRWSEAWIETNGEMVNGNGSGRAAWYIALFVLVCRTFIGVVPQMVDSLPLALTTFVDGSFSMTYPKDWQASVDDNVACALMECVQTFTLPDSQGYILVTRTNSFLVMLNDLETSSGGALFALSSINATVERTTKIQLDEYDAIQYNFRTEEQRLKGLMLIAKTDSEYYQIIGISLPEDFYLIEQALGTIQLDPLPNSQ